MQRKLTVILVEDDERLCEDFTACFGNMEELELLAVTDSAIKAITYVRDYRPDVVILDLELHAGEGNGIQFLTQLKQMETNLRPYVLVNTNNSSRTTYDMARRLGADFVMYKHQEGYCPREVAEFLLVVRESLDDAAAPTGETLPKKEDDAQHVRRRIYTELERVSVSPKSIGYKYLFDAIEMLVHDTVHNVTDVLGQKYGKTESSVERAMQNAINKAWSSADIEELSANYTARISSKKGVPTVTEFIYYYANKIKSNH